LFSCFFFQAEDGIRDFHVTGVQTCALPIWPSSVDNRVDPTMKSESRWLRPTMSMLMWPIMAPRGTVGLSVKCSEPRSPDSSAARSEERRVGKERRHRWAAYK